MLEELRALQHVSCLKDLFQWPKVVLRKIVEQKALHSTRAQKEWAGTMVDKLANQTISTAFSGIGGFEVALRGLAAEAAPHR